ncbi:MAG TPA: pyridoxamine 5'-phosphate oxidase family protein [Acidimicrobiales bacterium]|nr:pyridoxamine 5'-phosphate oxidase family protein [Acidimicrobiales bacterium]
MGRTYDAIDGRLAEFVLAQPVFFVATAPLSDEGLVNCSPKGNRGDLVVLGERTVAYRDLTGSGVETIAHLNENGRIVLMVCAFSGPPRIVRLHGRGEVVVAGDGRFGDLASHFPEAAGTRAVIVVDVTRVSDSCGYGVPVMGFERHRDNLDHWADTKGTDGLVAYRREKNAASLDGLPGYPADVAGA